MHIFLRCHDYSRNNCEIIINFKFYSTCIRLAIVSSSPSHNQPSLWPLGIAETSQPLCTCAAPTTTLSTHLLACFMWVMWSPTHTITLHIQLALLHRSYTHVDMTWPMGNANACPGMILNSDQAHQTNDSKDNEPSSSSSPLFVPLPLPAND